MSIYFAYNNVYREAAAPAKVAQRINLLKNHHKYECWWMTGQKGIRLYVDKCSNTMNVCKTYTFIQIKINLMFFLKIHHNILLIAKHIS